MNKRMKFLLMTIFLTLAIGVSACSSKPTPTPIAYYIETSVAATMQFQATLDSLRALEQQMTQMAMPTATPQPTWTPMPSPTIAQTQSLLPAAPAAPAAPVARNPLRFCPLPPRRRPRQVPACASKRAWSAKRSQTARRRRRMRLLPKAGLSKTSAPAPGQRNLISHLSAGRRWAARILT